MLSREYIKEHAKSGFIKRLLSNKRAEREASDLADNYAIARATGKPFKEVGSFHKGFKKVAFGSMGAVGARGGVRSLAKPARINPVSKVDAAGASTALPFSNPISSFAKHPKQAIKGLSTVRTGK